MAEIDPVLQLLIQSTERRDLNYGITVYVGGLVISGETCSQAHFGSSLEAKLERAAGRPGRREEESKAETPLDAPIEYLHLRNARVHFARGPLPRNRGEHMRIRLDQVQGWMYGIISPG